MGPLRTARGACGFLLLLATHGCFVGLEQSITFEQNKAIKACLGVNTRLNQQPDRMDRGRIERIAWIAQIAHGHGTNGMADGSVRRIG